MKVKVSEPVPPEFCANKPIPKLPTEVGTPEIKPVPAFWQMLTGRVVEVRGSLTI